MCPENKDIIWQASDDWVVPSVLRQEDEEEGRDRRERRSKRGQATAGVLSLLALLSLIPLTSEDQDLYYETKGQSGTLSWIVIKSLPLCFILKTFLFSY